MKVRLFGTPEAVLLGVCRLRQAFTTVEPSQPVPCPDRPGFVALDVAVKF
jgi:hypothetical protein